MATPKQSDPQFKLRLTPELKASIDEAAAANNRSINAEIIARLEESFTSPVTVDALVGASDVVASLRDSLEKRVAEWEAMVAEEAALRDERRMHEKERLEEHNNAMLELREMKRQIRAQRRELEKEAREEALEPLRRREEALAARSKEVDEIAARVIAREKQLVETIRALRGER